MMPIMSGWDFRKEQLKNPLLAKIPTIVMTAYPEAQIKSQNDGYQFKDFLNKPLKIEEILAFIQKYCE